MQPLRSLNIRHQLRNTARIGLDCLGAAEPSVSSVRGFFRNVCPQGTPAAPTTVNLAKRGRTSNKSDGLQSARHRTGFGYVSLSSSSCSVACLISCPGAGWGAHPGCRREAGDGRVRRGGTAPAPAEAGTQNTVLGDRHRGGSSSLRTWCIFSQPCFSASLYLCSGSSPTLVLTAGEMQETEKPCTGAGRPNSVVHSQTPGMLGRQWATWVFNKFSKAGEKKRSTWISYSSSTSFTLRCNGKRLQAHQYETIGSRAKPWITKSAWKIALALSQATSKVSLHTITYVTFFHEIFQAAKGGKKITQVRGGKRPHLIN